jgi:hypothetical protein
MRKVIKIEIDEIYQVNSPYRKTINPNCELDWCELTSSNGTPENIKKFKALYPHWGAFDKQRIRIISCEDENLDAILRVYIAKIEGGLDVSFGICASFIEEAEMAEEVECLCPLRRLMVQGCRCGAFQNETA